MITLVRRNVKIFFRDKSAVFFSLLSVFIIIGLFALFLGDVWVESLPDVNGARNLMDTWMISGILAVTSVTTTLGAFGIMVDDRSKKISKDFYAAPIKRGSITGGYLFSALIIGIIMTVVALVLSEIYLVLNGGEILNIFAMLQVLGIIILSTLFATAMTCFIVSFFKSQNAFSIVSTITGTLIGFLTGIYIPIGVLPEAVQMIVKVFPVSHAAVLFRNVFMSVPLNNSFSNAPQEVINGFNDMMGVSFKIGDLTITPIMSIAFLVVTSAIFFWLALANMSKRKIS